MAISFRRATAVVLFASMLALPACGSSQPASAPPPTATGLAKARSQSALSYAQLSCRYLLLLGQTITDGKSVKSTEAVQLIDKAVSWGQVARRTDTKWAPLATDVTVIKTDLESGQRATLQAHLTDFASRCSQIVQPNVPGTTPAAPNP